MEMKNQITYNGDNKILRDNLKITITKVKVFSEESYEIILKDIKQDLNI